MERGALSGGVLEFCTSEIIFFFHVGRNSANFAPPVPAQVVCWLQVRAR
jgi:hypothetical protein